MINDPKRNTWLTGGGEMGDLIRSMDWSKTSLGPIENWPQSLRTSVSLCLSSTFPINIVWGNDHVQIYNDSYRPICGALHPSSMGSKFKECWASALPVVGGAFDRGFEGEGTYIPNQRMFLERYGYLEEAFMTFSFSPIKDESGQVGGIFHPITESTEKMLSSRRTQVIRDLAIQLGKAKSLTDIYQLTSDNLANFELDIPFLLFYQDEGNQTFGLKKSNGIDSPKNQIDLSAALQSRALHEIKNLDPIIAPGSHVGPYEENPRQAIMFPIHTPGSEKPVMIVVAGVSSRRALDTDYFAFYDMLQSTITTAAANVLAYEEELKRSEALAQIDKAKTAFFSNVSHEFRTPLTLILGPLEDSINDTLNPLDSVQRQRQEVIHRNSQRLLKLVNSLLDFSRIEANRLQANFTPVNLPKFTADLASLFQSTVDKAGLKLIIDCPPMPEEIYVDQEMWEKITLNLLSNAFKFTFEGTITVRMRWTGEGARLEVIDTGIGVAEDELPRLFERFHRVQGAKSRSYEGTGIGLALVQELIHMHSGSIHVKSAPGKGTTFVIELPAGKKHLPLDKVSTELQSTSVSSVAFIEEAKMWLEASEPQTSPTKNENTPSVKPTVLLVDDNADMRSYVQRMLEKDFAVITARNGSEALELSRKQRPALILTDVMMPVLDGFGLLSCVRQDQDIKSTPVILLSARAGEEAKLEGLEAGADDYLVKPFSAKELLSRVSALLKMNDIRHHASSELRGNAEKFRSMFQHSAVSIAMLDLEGVVLEANESFLAMTGFSESEVVGHHFSTITHVDDIEPNIKKLQQLISGKTRSATFDKRYLKKDGGYVWVKTSVSSYFGPDDKPLYLIAVSQEIESLKNAVVNLEEEKDLREKFVATLTHDLRNPLSAAKLGAEIISRKIQDNGIKDQSKKIIHSLKRADQMIENLLDANRIKAGEKIPLTIEECNLNGIIQETLCNFSSQHGERFRFISDRKDITGYWSSLGTKRVLDNLLSNAIKYGSSAGPITVEARQTDSHVHLSVHNEGNPISTEDQENIFELYRRSSGAESGAQKGWGLGLTLVRGVLEAQGGMVIVESFPEMGTTFKVSLPLDSRPFYNQH